MRMTFRPEFVTGLQYFDVIPAERSGSLELVKFWHKPKPAEAHEPPAKSSEFSHQFLVLHPVRYALAATKRVFTVEGPFWTPLITTGRGIISIPVLS